VLAGNKKITQTVAENAEFDSIDPFNLYVTVKVSMLC
jgi:hypothetical protein